MVITTDFFKSSANVKFDLKNIDFLKKYLPTPSHAEALQGILAGFNNPSNRRSHIIIGPYGTGKSTLGTLLASIVSKNIKDQDFDYICNKFSSVDDEIHSELLDIKGLNRKYLPVILNGYEGKFKQSIISSIQKTLINNNINIIVPGIITKIIDTIEKWEKNYPKTFKSFKGQLNEREKDLELWRLEILAQNRIEIDWFRSIFPSLSSGAEFIVDFSEDFIEQIQFILEELDNLGIGLFIVYDEFGRFLQNLEHEEISETMQNLQDFAEFTDHGSQNLHLLFITHKHLRHYFSSFNEESQKEFQRIEKRFKLYFIDSDSSTFLRIAESVINSLTVQTLNKNTEEKIQKLLRKHPLFPQLNQVEIENLIVKGVYPVHPVTLYILPYLSSQYGQNERTLFTFLESKESNSLLEHLRENKGYYLPNKLFNYFFPNVFDFDFDEKDKIASIYKNIIKKVPDLSNNQISNEKLLDIIQFITLWELCGLQSKLRLTTDFISFAFNKESEEILISLKKLESFKSIRFNRIQGYWELFEGSNYNIDDLIEENKLKYIISKEKKLSLIEDSLTKKFYLSREYNDRKSMTRFASINLVFSENILNDSFVAQSVCLQKGADAIINLVLLGSGREKELVKDHLLNKSDQLSIYCIIPYSFTEIEDKVIRKLILGQLINDEELIINDKNLKKELQIHLEDATFELSKLLKTFFDFSSDLTWIINNKVVPIKNEIVLEEHLSKMMNNRFPLTPEVRNDGFNRRKLNSVQLKAGYKVIDHILTSPNELNIGIQGNGPEYLIYASIFKNNGFNVDNPKKVESYELKELRNSLLKELSDYSTGNFSRLINILKYEPYGVRPPLIPILLISLLRDKWDQLLFYNNEMYISQMNGEILYSMTNDPEKYKYVYLKLSNKFNNFISVLEDIFRVFIDTQEKKSIKPILVTTAMLKWLRNLPRYVQMTSDIKKELAEFKDCIKMSEIDPQKGLQLIYEQFGRTPDKIKFCVNELNNLFEVFKTNIISELCMIIGVKSSTDLKSWVDQQLPIFQKENKLVKTIFSNINFDDWIEKVAFDLVGVELVNWSDKTKEMFLVQVQNEFEKISYYNGENADSVIITLNKTTKIVKKAQLSTKSNTLYQNVTRILKNGGRNVPKDEIENIVLLLLNEFVE